ncbi:MAG: carboxypeptidase regulatory-like domain-containing protein [Saprospiraceae bacterium]|nr:carboxypeptidase regulatory-like domain-containing protein [Pyrinomonadaceae bacterium]
MHRFRLLILSALVLTFSFGGATAQDVADRVTAEPEYKKGGQPIEEEVPGTRGKSSFADLISATTYAFSSASGVALEDMSSGTTQLVGPGLDDNASLVTNIGFNFLYDGVLFTQFSANANGLAKLGPVAVLTTFNNTTTGIGTATNAPKIAAYFEDLCTGSTGAVRSKVVGTAPNRKLVVEWSNMRVTRGAGCTPAEPGLGTFQMWLFESAGATSPGVIQIVYGNGIAASASQDAGASIGLQSGAATNFASVTSSTDTVSYTVADNLNAAGIAAGKSYIFTPNVPAAPTALAFAPVTATSIQINWADNATNEVGYIINRSLDGINYTFLAQTAANATSFTDTVLNPATTYFYQVSAISEGASSAALSGSQATAGLGSDTCNGAGGNWSATGTWSDGTVPTASDNVTIGSGCTVSIDIPTAEAFAVTINSGGTLQSPLAGTVTTNNLTVSGNLTNNGTLDLSTNGNTSGAGLTFGGGAVDVTLGGSGAVTDVFAITVAKGAQATTVELNATNFTVQGVNTDAAGYLTVTSGTFKISGTFTMTNRTFPAAGYTIPTLGGLWMNNPNYTVAGQNGSPSVGGRFRVTSGTYNIGTATGNSMGFTAGANITVEGGAINATGRFGVAAAATLITYNQSGGAITVCTIGNASTTLACFDLGTSTASFAGITGGSIVVQLASTAATGPRDYRLQSGSATTSGGILSVTGGTLQLGNASTVGPQAFSIQGVVPNLVVTNNGGANTAIFGAVANWNNITRNITVATGTTLNFGNLVFLMNGTTFTNNGTVTHNGAASRFVWFLADLPQTYTGSGTVTAPMTSFEGQNGVTILDASVSNIVVRRVILFAGGVQGANKLTLGMGDAVVTNTQFGNTTTPTNAGTFDSAPTFNLGTGGQNISYLRTVNTRVTGPEINPARTLVNLTYDDNDPTHSLTVTGGDLTVNGVMALTNGRVITGSNVLTNNGTATRTTGFVDGTLNRSYTAAGSYTYHVGQNGYSPVLANIGTLTTNPSSLSVRPTDSTLPGLDPATAASRFWTVTETGDMAATLTFTYLDPADVNGDESNYATWRSNGGAPVLIPGSTPNPGGNNVATAAGITDLSGDWGLGASLAGPSLASISGQVTTAGGRGMPNARLTLTGGALTEPRVYTSSGFGYYRFDGLTIGQTYTVTVGSKRYAFVVNSQTVVLGGDTIVNFVANP